MVIIVQQVMAQILQPQQLTIVEIRDIIIVQLVDTTTIQEHMICGMVIQNKWIMASQLQLKLQEATNYHLKT